MGNTDIASALDGKWEDGTRPKDLYRLHVKPAPAEYVAAIVAGLGDTRRKVQAGFAELASLLSADAPGLLYPHVDVFLRNVEAKAPVLRWEAVCTLGNLVPADGEGRIPAAVPQLAAHLGSDSIVLQGYAVKTLARIAEAWPETAPGILDALLAVEERFPGNRVGYLVEAMGAFASVPGLAVAARAFAWRHARSEIRAVAAKAKKTLKRFAG